MMDGYYHWMGGMYWGWLLMAVILVLLVILVMQASRRNKG
jgi:uncharacterized membrane protein